MATTGAVANVLNEVITGYWDSFKPQVAIELKKKYGKGLFVIDVFRSLFGRTEAVMLDEWSGYEENYPHRVINVAATGSAAASGAGLSATIRLAASDVGAAGSNYAVYPKIGHVVQCYHATYPTGVPARIDSITGLGTATVTLTVFPVNSAITIPDQSSQQLPIIANLHGAGTPQPIASVTDKTKREFVATISKETLSAEGTQLVNEDWVKIARGQNISSWFNYQFLDAEFRMDLAIEGNVLLSELNSNGTNLLVSATNTNGTSWPNSGVGNAFKSIRGINSWVNPDVGGLGWKETYTAGSFDTDNIDDMVDNMRAQGITSGVVLVLCGHDVQKEIDSFGLTVGSGVGGDKGIYGYKKKLFGDMADLSLSLGFTAINKGGLTFVFQVVDSFSNPSFLGASSFGFEKLAYVFPVSTVSVQDEAGKRNTVPNFCFKKRAMNGYDRFREIWINGAAGRMPYIGQVDETNTYFRDHYGIELWACNQMGFLSV